MGRLLVIQHLQQLLDAIGEPSVSSANEFLYVRYDETQSNETLSESCQLRLTEVSHDSNVLTGSMT